MHQDLGRKLYANGWTQGVLLDPVAISVVFAPAHPVSKLAKAALRKTAPDTSLPSAIPYGVAYGVPSSTIRLVIISQPCDIVKPLNDEPNILAMPVFRTDNVKILGPAAANSSRYFLLDASRGYVVDGTTCSVIEKPVLEPLTPEVGVGTDDLRRRFARWLARRFNRPALPDDVVAAIVKPLLENLRVLQEQGKLDLELLDRVLEVRVRVANPSLPFSFDLLFIVEEPDDTLELRLAAFMGDVRKWFIPEVAVLNHWHALAYGEISVADYLAAEQIYLDEYTYRGGTIRGLVAPDPA